MHKDPCFGGCCGCGLQAVPVVGLREVLRDRSLSRVHNAYTGYVIPQH